MLTFYFRFTKLIIRRNARRSTDAVYRGEVGSASDPFSVAAAKPLPLRPSFARHSGLREGGRVKAGSVGYYYVGGKNMKKNHLVTIAITIFIVFVMLTAIKQGRSAKEQSCDVESRISDLESQVQDLEYRAR
ncbi:MAG: hypothetical protein MUO61_06740 [Dehalococcoidia bacterium]|nr:hypothetical protein [Dehalococcoidia bacterium]